MQTFDVVIVGGGIVGLTQALALKNSGLSVAVVDGLLSKGMPNGAPLLRVSALTLASQTVLQNIGAWQHLDPARMSRYENMSVWDQDSFANIKFTSNQVPNSELGYVLENQVIRHALWLQAEQSDFIQLLVPKKIQNIVFGQQECFISLDDASHLTARLVIGADGANSIVKKQANLVETFWDYEQQAIVATIKTKLAHQHIARQVFTSHGPLAFLPLWDDYHCSIVWSQDVDKAEQLMALSKSEFEKELTVAFDAKARFMRISQRQTSLSLKNAVCATMA
ncbi:FAD-dependent monooxygenase [Paraglaciecola aquimarina]|uniref:FAD-dependent monooxygenase n=1 Tax=Paraglaciecola aquimarina TaxID=1235557 RepID=A0ABU3SWE1_9ALTE|nr:FAD-dependent monooxygenase [Paraglaciecola aquimarina]MDU0354337.1 FAD-dependent monooxygenase [Paraglaciecola aquimarina]